MELDNPLIDPFAEAAAHIEADANFRDAMARLRADGAPLPATAPPEPAYLARKKENQSQIAAERGRIMSEGKLPAYMRAQTLALKNMNLLEDFLKRGIVKLWRFDSQGVLWVEVLKQE